MNERILTTEEREEYDALLFEAGYDDSGKPRPSHEIGTRLAEMLRDAAYKAQRAWAGYVLDDATEAGCLARWKNWNRRREVIEVAGKSYVTTKAAAMSVRRQDADGRLYYQPTFWADMTREQLAEIVKRTAKSIRTEQETIATARRLLSLLDRVPEASTVAEAAKALGLTTEGYLSALDEAA